MAHEESACVDALTARGTQLDVASVQACAAALDTVTCDSVDGLDVCTSKANGALVDGTACSSGLQCVSGHCAGAEGSGSGPGSSLGCGVCAAKRVADGQTCESTIMAFGGGCEYGSDCTWFFDFGSAGSVLTTKCAYRHTTENTEGASCTRSSSCSNGFYCRPNEPGNPQNETGTCAKATPPGGKCPGDPIEGPPCTRGTTCIEGTCKGPGAVGEACSVQWPGSATFLADSCQEGLACDGESKTCAEIVKGAPGAACDDATLRCDRGFCSITNEKVGKCIAYIAVGQPCDASDIRNRCEGRARCVAGRCTLSDSRVCR